MMKNVKNIFKNLALACAVVMVMADCSYAQTMGEDTGLKTIICGKKTLCTIGKEAGQSERVCIEIKKIEKNKCDYECQGAGEEWPSDCSKRDKYSCQRITQSKEDCNLKNNGNAVNPAFLSGDYENYKEASYSKAEREGLPKCADIEGGSATCLCNGNNLLNKEIQFTPVVCNKGQLCLHQANTVGGNRNDYYCMYKEQLDVEGARKKDSIWHNTEVMATNGEELTAEMNTTGCPLVSKYLQKYTSGCWSCLVVEKLTSSFLRVASVGLPVCEKAGKTLLFWGFIIWLCFWALKNVASFTEIKGGNALNDLLKMGAKVVLAYFCILSATEAIREFVITPIMGIGSTIAQGYVYDKAIMNSNKTMKDYGWEDFDWDIDPFVDHSEEFSENEVITTQINTTSGGTGSSEGVSDENAEEQAEIAEMDEQIGAETEIPPFQIPGTDGSLTSFPGCRIPPPTPSGCGSFAHMGLDVGAGHHSPIWAMAGGTVQYSKMGGYGNVVVVTTEHKGNRWEHMYAHMDYDDWKKYSLINAGKKVARGTIIGGVGCTSSGGPNEKGCAYAYHLHVEVVFTGTIEGKRYESAILDPVSLGDGKIVVRGHKRSGVMSNTLTADCDCRQKGGCKKHSQWPGHKPAFEDVHPKKKWCLGFNLTDPNTSIKRGQKFPKGGITSPGVAKVEMSEVSGGEGSGYADGFTSYDANAAADSLIVSIPDIKYTGPTDIMPRSVMNSMLAAVKAITDTTAQLQVLGNMATCFSNVKEGGAWHIIFSVYMTNLWMWIDGAILWVLGFVLTCVIAYYLVDISFKIGFAVMALPVVMGLWPFKVTAGKLADVISIIAKSSALFAFLTISAYYAIQLIVAGIGGTNGLQGFFTEFDGIISGSVEGDERDILIQKWKDSFNIFSSGFVLTLFACFYAYKLIGKTTGDLVEKFYPDNVFGSDSNPMHKGMTTLASGVNKLNQKYGTGLIKDIAGHQAGKLVRNTLSVPRNLAIKGFNAVKGKIKNKKGGDEQ